MVQSRFESHPCQLLAFLQGFLYFQFHNSFHLFLMVSQHNLDIMGRVQKLLQKALVYENFLKIQLKINKSKNKDTFS